MNQEKGIVYILVNPCLPDWTKLGMTRGNDITRRLDELNKPSNLPLAFRAYALYHVDDPCEVEKDIHQLIDLIDNSLRAREELSTGRIRQREFFRISPERAYAVFKLIAKNRGDLDCLELVAATDEELMEEEIASERQKPFRFDLVDIPIGETISFLKDESITATVADQGNHISYNGQMTTMSALAALLLDRPGKSFQGPRYFVYKGEALSDRRRRIENHCN